MLVRERMTPNPITITKQTTIANALQIMREHKVRRLPVMDGNKLVGIVTDRDLSEVSPSPATTLSIFELNYLLAKSTIADIVAKNSKLITIGPDSFIEEAALMMRNNKIGAMPVVEKEQLIGIITETNIFDAFVDTMGLRQTGYRITITLGQDRAGVLAELTKLIAANDGNITHIVTYYGSSNEAIIVIRLNKGDIKKIMRAISDLGYSANYIETNL